MDKTKIAVVLFSFALLALLILYGDPQKLFNYLSKADPAYIALAMVSATCVIFVHVLRFKFLIRDLGKIAYFELFPIQMFGVALANVTPGRAAEPTKALILKSTHGFSFTKVFSKNMLERLSDMMVVVAFSLLALAYADNPALYAPIIFFAVFVFAFVFITQSKTMEKAFIRISYAFIKLAAGVLKKTMLKQTAAKLESAAAKNLDKITHLFEGLKLSRDFAVSIFLTLLIWIFSALVYLFSFQAIGVDLVSLGVNPVLFCLGAIAVATLVGLVSMLPGGTGAQEFSFVFLLTGVGVEKELAVSAVLLGRLLTFWFMVSVGLASSVFIKKLDLAANTKKSKR